MIREARTMVWSSKQYSVNQIDDKLERNSSGGWGEALYDQLGFKAQIYKKQKM